MTIAQLNERANLLASEMDANDEENRVYQSEIDKIYARIDALKSDRKTNGNEDSLCHFPRRNEDVWGVLDRCR
ncbi:hypothetical protein DF026_17155 [Burkholderia stagnalis]|nr:hypothetical protein DF025_17345 [Burkholderia stagnalis]RQR20358.1 hypothetical protein DF026_17155 [Burkholderia stagnalis]